MATSRICSIDGCGKRAHCKGMCSAHHHRWVRHGDPSGGLTANGAPLEFLLEAISSDSEQCIKWPYAKQRGGYGAIAIDGVMVSAHIVVCERTHGPKPTPAHEVAHSCGNGHRGCINPRHVRWATHSQNLMDKVAHGTDNRGERNPLSVLTSDAVREIRRRYGTVSQAALAREFGVTDMAVKSIITGKTWSWLP